MSSLFSQGTGWIIPGSRCPECSSPMKYNGNYWCSECSWVLPDQEDCSPGERVAFEVAYVLLMRQTGREPDASVITASAYR